VEDQEMVSGPLVSLLEPTYVVDVASTGEQALEMFSPGKYDIALIDLTLPGIDGDQVAREMRALDPCLGTVLTTGLPLDKDDPRRSVCDGFVQKPPAAEELWEALRRAYVLHGDRVAGCGRANT